MHSKITKIAAAAVVIVGIAGLFVGVFQDSTTRAYAIEQTIQASHTIRFIHVKAFVTSHKEPKEFWTEFDEYGALKNLRLELPEWSDPYGEDGGKSIIWKDNKAQVWVHKKNVVATIKNRSIAAEILQMFTAWDPKIAIEQFNNKSINGNAKIEIAEPSDIAAPITVTVTSISNEPLNQDFLVRMAAFNKTNAEEPAAAAASIDPNNLWDRAILFIDQATKLVTAIEFYHFDNGQYLKTSTLEYLDYNQPIDQNLFTLNIPSDAMVIDQTAQEVGLLQGQLSEKQIAVEVVRQFLEALIARDFAKAGQLMEGIPARKMQEQAGNTKYLRIISIGEPTPYPVTGGYKVPCVIEIEKDGQIEQWSPNGPFVRQVHGQPQRWTICGGI